jgi:hypothetical protein
MDRAERRGLARRSPVPSLAPDDREHFRRTMAEIIASCPTSRLDHC